MATGQIDNIRGRRLVVGRAWEMPLDKRDRPLDNLLRMTQSVEQIVRDYRKASAALRRKYNTPAKARQFLLKVGILERHTGSKNGVRLAKPYRSE